MIEKQENAIIAKGAYYLEVSREDVSNYLNDIKISVSFGRCYISPRDKNQSLYIDYVFSEERCWEIILDLEVKDFSDAVPNDHPQHPEETLYIFGKDVDLLPKQGGGEEKVSLYIKFNKLPDHYVIIVSFHKQEYPLAYKFR